MKLLTLTSLFPGVAMPRHGVFVKERLADYRRRFDADIRVVAPVPWVPPFSTRPKDVAFKRTPRREEYDGFSIEHPRYLVLPKIGMALQGIGYERGVR
ncbi:MAG: glycosyltransferase family 4 protein, partial [Planctomycetes bacterium]|nr:glycosyltransferase family 4 protein [Planctomycetota bacterium]